MKNRGMTLIEVLTVIAIITILAAIILPVTGMVREKARRASCQSNLASLSTALKSYKLSEGGYPPQLLGYVERFNAAVVPVEQMKNGFLVTRGSSLDIGIFRCANRYKLDSVTTVIPVWPAFVWPAGSTLSGPINTLAGQPFQHDGVNSELYVFDSFDMGFNKISNRFEEHYTLFWTTMGLDDTITDKGSDDLRQLGYKVPDESAIVTWDSYHYSTGQNAGLPESGKNAIVLYLNGSVKLEDQRVIAQYGWAYRPSP